MAIRVECTTPGLEECFIEVKDRWRRDEIVALFQPGQVAPVFRLKVTACRMALVNSDAPMVDPALVYDEEGQPHADLDVRLLPFLPAALVMAVDQVSSLGKANARLSSGGSERALTTMPPTAKPTKAKPTKAKPKRTTKAAV